MSNPGEEIVTGQTVEQFESYHQTAELLKEVGEQPYEGRPFLRCYLCKRKAGDVAVSYVQKKVGLDVRMRKLKFHFLYPDNLPDGQRKYPLCNECVELLTAVGYMMVEDVLENHLKQNVSKTEQNETEGRSEDATAQSA